MATVPHYPEYPVTEEYLAGGSAPVNGALIGAGPTDVLGRWWNNISGKTAENMFNADQARITREFNSAEAKKDRDWQEYMSNTAYQRQVQDMINAGINPASIGGDGASVSGGASASASPASASGGSANGGFLGLVGGIAKAVIAAALYKKFSNSANRSSSAAGVLSNVGDALSETRLVYNRRYRGVYR